MKSNFTIINLILFFLVSLFTVSFAQEKTERIYNEDMPALMISKSHDPNFVKTSTRSFYQRKTEWQAIIDSTWGLGIPLHVKLNIFDTYFNHIRNEFDGFLSLGMDFTSWNSLRLYYRDQIDSTTSKGRFNAIMGHLSIKLKDFHTAAANEDIVFNTPLNPGVPIFCNGGFRTIEHCGAVVTILPDSSVLVLRTVQNHPLGLQPGDIILGYEGVPYVTIVNELLAAELPYYLPESGATSAIFDHHMMGAAMNWHLFNTIDILKHSTGDTLHLSVDPMINLNVPLMLNNEQIPVPGVSFPNYFREDVVSYGKLNGTNIGYIYLFSEDRHINIHPDIQFYEAINELQNTEGLIIDMRWNEGGNALFDDACKILFNESPFTLNGVNRCSPTTLNLCPNNDSTRNQIRGNASSIYDHPIAILLGPTCVSMGDITAHRFSYHPMVKFFGKPPAASFGDNIFITNFTGWWMRYSIEDMYHLNQPGFYLNRTEFPIDFPVWHNPNDAANGIDAVVDAAISWMDKMIYPFNVKTNSTFIKPQIDTLTISAQVANPESHNVNVAAIINSTAGTFVDSLPMFDDGNHADSLAGDGLYGCYLNPISTEDVFIVSASITDLDSNHYHILPNAKRFTTIGPIKLDSLEIPAVAPLGFALKLFLKNKGSNTTANNVSAEISFSDTNITNISNNRNFGSIAPGEIKSASNYSILTKIHPDSLDNLEILIKISSSGYMFWEGDTIINVSLSSIKTNTFIPFEFSLKQNYPNPFNPTTTIEFSIPKSEFVTLKVYNILGQEVVTLVSEKLKAGNYKYDWDASGFASGVYYCKLQSNSFFETRKLILLK